jgi:hypothetical protein
MSLQSYLARLEDTIRSRKDISIESLTIINTTFDAIFRASLRFLDNSRLMIGEDLEAVGQRGIKRISFLFHYQRADNSLIFRYDNSPHYPRLSTFPAHKHTEADVVAADPPDLADVLNEINIWLYPPTNAL